MNELKNENDAIHTLDSLHMRINIATCAEKAFIRYSMLTIAVLILVAVAKGDQTSTTTISIFGNLEIPRDLITKQILIIRIFFSSILFFSFVEWALAIINYSRHPLARAFCGRKSAVVILADRWDAFVKVSWLHMNVILDLLQKALFLTIIGLILIALWTL